EGAAGHAAPSAPAEAKRYSLTVEAPKEAKVGKKSQFRIVLKALAGFHINQEFPVEITLAAAHVKLLKGKLAKADAQRFTQEEAHFDAEFTPEAAGEAEFSAKARFAVCTDKDCFPVRETLTWKTAAKQGP